jgi:hypothetical protein
LLNRIAAKTSGSHPSTRHAQSVDQLETLDEIARFWERAIAESLDPSGKPSLRAGNYRIQLACCLARGGNHKRAFDQVGILRDDESDDESDGAQRAHELARICALCATAAEDDPPLAHSYIAEAMLFLRQGASKPITPPPLADDPDFAALVGEENFPRLLQEWQENWSRPINLRQVDL